METSWSEVFEGCGPVDILLAILMIFACGSMIACVVAFFLGFLLGDIPARIKYLLGEFVKGFEQGMKVSRQGK